MKKRLILSYILVCGLAAALAGGCVKKDPEPAIPNAIPSGSKFSKIAVGWSMKQVHEAIGKPTDSHGYETGTKVLSVSFGTEYRIEDLYKGNGRIIYEARDGQSSQDFPVQRIIYDPYESGRLDKAAYPDGPQNQETAQPAPGWTGRSGKRGSAAKAAPAGASPAEAAQSAPAPKAATPKAASDDPLGGL